MSATNTEMAKVRPVNGPTTIEGYVTCDGGQATIKTVFAEITSVQLTQKRGLLPNTLPPEFDAYTSDGAITVFVYSNNQEGGNDVVYYRISGRL